MLNFLAQRLVQLIPTLFFVSILIFSLQHLLPGDPALVMAGEERDPAVIEQIRRQYHLDQPIPPVRLLGQGRAVGRFRRVAAQQGSGAQPDRAKAAGDDAACVDGHRDRVPDRNPGRHRFRGEEGHGLGLWRQFVRAVGYLDAEFLSRHHADLPVSRYCRLATCIENWRASISHRPAFVLGTRLPRSAHLRAMLQVLELCAPPAQRPPTLRPRRCATRCPSSRSAR